MKMNMHWNYPPEAIAKRITKNNKVRLETANCCAKVMDKYIPMDSGLLAQNVSITPGMVTYNQRYAHVNYYNQRNFRKDKHPLAKCKWSEISKNDYNLISKEIEQFMKG